MSSLEYVLNITLIIMTLPRSSVVLGIHGKNKKGGQSEDYTY